MDFSRVRAPAATNPLEPLADLIADRVAERLRKDLGLDKQRLFSVAEAAQYLGRSAHAVRHLIAKGELSKVQRGDQRVFLDRDELDQWIEMGKTRG